MFYKDAIQYSTIKQYLEIAVIWPQLLE